MTTVAQVASVANAGDLQRAAFEARDRFEVHWSVCRTARRDGERCQRCDDLDLAAYCAENAAMLEASRG